MERAKFSHPDIDAGWAHLEAITLDGFRLVDGGSRAHWLAVHSMIADELIALAPHWGHIDGMVYVIDDTVDPWQVGEEEAAKHSLCDPVKIGFSVDPARRLAELQTGHPRRLNIMHQAHAPRAVERHLHQRFAAAHVRGEWFRWHGAIHRVFDALRIVNTAIGLVPE